MPEVLVNSLMDGLVLSTNVVDAAGNMIIPAGAVVNHSVRNRLLHAKVARVFVTDESYGLFSLVKHDLKPLPRQAPAAGPASALKSPARAGNPAPKAPVRAEDSGENNAPRKSDTVAVQNQLMRLAHMFAPYREDPLMRELLRLAIKCAQERLISV